MFEKSDNSIFAFYGEQRQSKILSVRIWIFQIVAAITFLMEGESKLAGVKMIVNAFEQIGIGQSFDTSRKPRSHLGDHAAGSQNGVH